MTRDGVFVGSEEKLVKGGGVWLETFKCQQTQRSCVALRCKVDKHVIWSDKLKGYWHTVWCFWKSTTESSWNTRCVGTCFITDLSLPKLRTRHCAASCVVTYGECAKLLTTLKKKNILIYLFSYGCAFDKKAGDVTVTKLEFYCEHIWILR